MFPDARRIIHLFSGSLTREQAQPPKHPDFEARVIRVDANAERDPDIIADAEGFVDLFPGMFLDDFDLVVADPPYSIQDAENYGRPLCNKKKVLEQCYRTLRPGGLLLWMDQSIPMYAKRNWKWVGTITMYRSTNHRIRGVMIFEKQ